MTIKLISLVIITLFLLSGHSYSEDQFLFPKKKPSIFKSTDNREKIDFFKNLPQRKPIVQKDENIEKKKIVEKKEVKEEKEIKKKEIITQKKLIYFSSKKTCYLQGFN